MGLASCKKTRCWSTTKRQTVKMQTELRMFNRRSSHKDNSAAVQGEDVWPEWMSLHPGFIEALFNALWCWLVCSPSPKASESFSKVSSVSVQELHATNIHSPSLTAVQPIFHMPSTAVAGRKGNRNWEINHQQRELRLNQFSALLTPLF